MRQIAGAWKQVIPGATEALTVIALLQWAKGRTATLNVGCICIAWVAHVMCYLDVFWGTDYIYSHYETVIQIVAVAQLFTFHATVTYCGSAVAGWVSSFSLWRPRIVCVASVRPPVPHLERTKVL